MGKKNKPGKPKKEVSATRSCRRLSFVRARHFSLTPARKVRAPRAKATGGARMPRIGSSTRRYKSALRTHPTPRAHTTRPFHLQGRNKKGDGNAWNKEYVEFNSYLEGLSAFPPRACNANVNNTPAARGLMSRDVAADGNCLFRYPGLHTPASPLRPHPAWSPRHGIIRGLMAQGGRGPDRRG